MTADVAAALHSLDEQGVAWCIWKGSDHVAASLAGSGDLDILVDAAADPATVHAALTAAGLRPSVDRSRPGGSVEDWFGLAGSDAALVHLQLYRRLLVDDGLVDRWRIPVEAAVLARRQRHPDGCWIAHPADEAVLVALQGAARPDTPIRRALRRPVVDHDALRRRIEAFLARTTPSEIESVATCWFGGRTGSLLHAALTASGPAGAHAWAAFGAEAGELPDVERVPRRGGRTARRLVTAGLDAVRSRVTDGGRGRRRGRTLTGAGCIVAVVGSDGSGKSSLVADLAEQYTAKLDTRVVYFGSGDGHSLSFVRPLKSAQRTVRRAGTERGRSERPSDGAPSGAGRARTVTRDLARGTWAVALAFERRLKARSAARARARGSVVLCDRFPQVQEPGVHDGPRLGTFAGQRGWRCRLAAWEQRSYERTLAVTPDLVVRLRVSPDVAQRRRPEHDAADLRRRIAVVAGLRFAGATVDLDADRSPAEVRRAARVAVFAALR